MERCGPRVWSSTGTSINEESAIGVLSVEDDPLIHGFACHFTAIWDRKPADAGACSNTEVAFAPSSKPIALIKEEITRAQKSIDVLMHHFVFDDLVTELAKAAERGIRVRVIVNAADRTEPTGARWDRLGRGCFPNLRESRGSGPAAFRLLFRFSHEYQLDWLVASSACSSIPALIEAASIANWDAKREPIPLWVSAAPAGSGWRLIRLTKSSPRITSCGGILL